MRELLLETNVQRRKGIHRVCPRCGKVGILTKKWGSRVYYPQGSSAYVTLPYMLEQGYVTGERYRGVIDDSETFDKKSSYKVRYPQKYEQWCIAHYESGGLRKQCSLRKGTVGQYPQVEEEKNKTDYNPYHFGKLPRLQKPEKRKYQRKKESEV